MAQVDEIATFYPPQAGRPTAVLLATLVAGAWVWTDAIRALRERGFGCLVLKHPYPAEHGSVAPLVAQTLELMDHFEIERATLIGASLGSLVAIDCAIAHPERVASLVISGAPTRERPELGIVNTGKVTLPNAVHIAGKLVADRGCVSHAVIEETFRYFRDRRRLTNLVRLLRESSEYDTAARLPLVECDVLMVWGEDDEISSCEGFARLAPLVRRGSFVRLAGCGHSPMVERPDEFNAALFAHLAAVSDVNVSRST